MAETQRMRRQYVVFRVARENYGIPIEQVQEVIKSVDITRLPHTPDSVKGIIQLRERVIPIMSLCSHFGADEADNDDKRIIIVNFADSFIGLEVDSVEEVLEIPAENIDALGTSMNGSRREYLEGIGKVDDGLIILLKLEELLGEAEKQQLQEAVEATEI